MPDPTRRPRNPDLDAALREVVHAETQRTNDRAYAPASRPSGSRSALLLTLGLGLLAWIWIGRPAWLFGPGLRPLTAAEADASARYAIYLQRARVEKYLATRGALPLDLAELGPEVGVPVRLRATGGLGYELGATVDDHALRYDSRMNADSFLGGSVDLLRARRP